MKTVYLLVAILLMTIINACTAYYYIRTDVAKNLDVKRSVYASSADGSSVDFPFVISGRWSISKLPEPYDLNDGNTRASLESACIKERRRNR